jgi:LAO/AO transport system kinase
MTLRKRLPAQAYLDGILNGDISVLSQAITLIESMLPADADLSQAVVEACLPHAGRSYRVGITGTPGVGKSTFIEAFGLHLLHQPARKLAVLAVDPSSRRSGGSILGDKTRMEQLSVHPRCYIRPSPSGAALGGVHRATRETILLCEAAGFDTIFVETVGVGQSETLVRSMVDFFLLLIQAGGGDELQGIKRGIMEMADGLLVTKADGDNLAAARRAQVDYGNALHLYPMPASGWAPQVLSISALEGKGLDATEGMLRAYHHHAHQNGYWQQNRTHQLQAWLQAAVEQAVLDAYYHAPGRQAQLAQLTAQVAAGTLSPTGAARQALQ